MAAIRENPSLTVVRSFNAPPEKVWGALTQPEACKARRYGLR